MGRRAFADAQGRLLEAGLRGINRPSGVALARFISPLARPDEVVRNCVAMQHLARQATQNSSSRNGTHGTTVGRKHGILFRPFWIASP